jgi:hypothetical protein
MKSKNLVGTTCVLMAGMMAAGSLLAAPATASAPCQTCVEAEDWNYQQEASRLLKQIQAHANALAGDADVLSIYAHGSISRHSHAIQVNLVKDRVNAIGKPLNRLQAIRHVAAPWQRQAIDSVAPIAASLAAQTEAAIQHLNETGKPLWVPHYTDLLRSISDRSDQVKQTIDLHLDLAGTHEKLEELRNRVNQIGS